MKTLSDQLGERLLAILLDTQAVAGRSASLDVAGAQLASALAYMANACGPEHVCALLDHLANDFAGQVAKNHPERYVA